MTFLKMDILDMLVVNKRIMEGKVSIFIKKNHSKWTMIKIIFLVFSILIFYSYPLFNLDVHNLKEELLLSILNNLLNLSIIFYIFFIPVFFIELFLLMFFKIEKKKILTALIILIFYSICVFTAYDRYAVYKFRQYLNERNQTKPI